ncbi:MAG: gliding motility-associated C-terminal domain-containing protein [Chitinophagaceae bacterium]|nr:gliding motility-associated C-terminal domain-containing protein [Chitinophagaceae bacterium]
MRHPPAIRLSVSFFLCFFYFQSIYAQVPAIEWHKAFGGKNGEYAHSIEPTFDGGYITAGYTEGPDNGDLMGYHGDELIGDLWVVKMDAAGNMEWQKCLGGSYVEHGAFIRQTQDGGYILAGSTNSVDCNIKSNNSLDYWIVKLNATGDIQWQKNYGGTKNEYAWDISIGQDGSYFIAGSSESSDGDVTGNKGETDYWVIKLDVNGNLIWQKSMGGGGEDAAYSVQATPDGGCITAGHASSVNGDVTNNHGASDYWVVKLSNTGNIAWQKCYGGSGSDVAWSIKPVLSGGYIIGGHTSSNNGDVSGNHGPGADFWLVKIDQSGTLQWQKCYGGSKNEMAYALDVTPDGGYIVAGNAESDDGDLNCHASITDVWVIKVNSSGALEWQKSMGGNHYDEAYDIKALGTGQYIISGITCSDDVTERHPHQGGNGTCGDFWIIKLTASNVTPVPEVTISPASGKVCAGSAATFKASVKYGGTHFSYRWERNEITVGGDQAWYTASDWNDNDQLRCYVTSGGTCEAATQSASNAVTINITSAHTTPVVNLVANNTVICDCEPVIISATVTDGGEAPHFQWQVNGVNKDNNSNWFTSGTFRNGDEIRCIYTDNSSCIPNGSVESNTIKITTGTTEPATVNITTPDNMVCKGAAVSFTAVTQNAGTNVTYLWKVNDISVGDNSNTYTTSSLKNNDQVSCSISVDPQYTCAGSTSATSNIITMTVNEALPPTVTITASQTNICQNYPVTFTATTQNAGNNPSWQWMINGISAGSNKATFVTSALNDKDEINCTVTIDPSNTCAPVSTAISNSIIINVSSAVSPSISIQSSKTAACAGESIEFRVSVANAGASPVFTWKVNDMVTGNNEDLFRTTTLRAGDQVSCEMMPGADAACANTPVLSNSLSPVIYDTLVISVYPSDTAIISGTQIQLKPLVTENVVAYEWSPVYQLEDPLSFNPLTKNLTESQTYIITAQNEHLCKGSAKATIKVFTDLFMPNVFTPNNDRVNDIFRIPPGAMLILKEFSVFDRWGNKIFSSGSIDKGWDGKINGSPAPTGTYIYFINGTDNHGTVNRKGTVTLLR